jgi:hypothetical protein
VDDQELNDELKEKERWNDPAAGFLTVSSLQMIMHFMLIIIRKKRINRKEKD